MTRRLLFVSFLAGLCCVSIAAGGVGRLQLAQKQLPLDNLPGVGLKTRMNSEYLPDRLIVKLMPGVDISTLTDYLAALSVSSVEELFPSSLAERNRSAVDLTRFYVLRYSAPLDPFSVAEELSGLPAVHYAEPWFMYPVEGGSRYTPNDPMFASQYGLTRIQAPNAWDVTQGDSAVVIGIVDTGVEVLHPDLAGNIWRNPGEVGVDGQGNDKRTNGIDDDGNGYIDDWRGWDFGGADYNNVVGDNNPSPVGSNTEHGTHVAGIASASTDNGIGVAGTGFRCKLMAVKTSADNDTRGPGGSAYIIMGYPGIVYAALMGAHVVNCSWGGTGGSQFEQDMVNAATQQGTLIVAAAGNSGSSAAHYPSGYDNVISVAATNASDVRASFSNFGMTVDLAAPGVSILSTIYPSTYTSSYSGTSMSSPFVAGVAGLVRAMNPSFTALQVGEQTRVTADNIDAQNPSYVGLLGKGRVNAHRAVTVSSPSIRASRLVVRDSIGGNNNGNPEPNETIDLYFTFTNYLAATTNAAATLTTTATGLTVVNGTYAIGSLGTLDTVRNFPSPFRIQLASNVAQGLVASLKLTFTDGSYSDFQWFSIVVNPTYQNHNVNEITVTMTNNGRIGYNNFPTNTQGVGFIYPSAGSNHLFEGGVIMGYSAARLVSNVRNPSGTQDNDFLARTIYQLQSPGIISNQDGYTWFSDSSAPIANRLGVRVDQYTYAFSHPEHDDYVIVRYDIRNLTAADISGFRIGQFFDWDIANYATNRTGYDATRSLAYAWDQNTPTAPYIGMRALDSATSVRGLQNVSGIVLDRAAKWSWISGGTSQSTVGPQDVHNVIASGPFTIPAGGTVMVGFAMIGGADLGSLQTHADAAKIKWEEIRVLVSAEEPEEGIPATYALEQNYPNPFNPTTRIRFTLPAPEHATLKVFDILGREITTLIDKPMDPGAHEVEFNAAQLAGGVYYYRLQAGSFHATKSLLLLK